MNYPVPDFHPRLWWKTRNFDAAAVQNKTPELSLRGFSSRETIVASAHQPVAHHEAVEAELGNLPPLIAIIGKLGQRGIGLLEGGVLGGDFGVELHRRLERGLHDIRREGMQLGTTGQQ